MKKAKPISKFDWLFKLLGDFGADRITRDQFWGQMKTQGYTQNDIDQWCDEYHKLTNRSEDNGRKDNGTTGATAARDARGPR